MSEALPLDVNSIPQQLEDIRRKLDILTDRITAQRLKQEAIEDLAHDLSLIGKDAYRSAVDTLEHQGITLDPRELGELMLRFLKHIHHVRQTLDLFESALDFAQDAAPIAREVLMDFIRKMHEFETRGYFSLLRDVGEMMDTARREVDLADVSRIVQGLGPFLHTIGRLSDPDFLRRLDRVVDDIAAGPNDGDPPSLIHLLRELSSPDTRRSLAWLLTLARAFSSSEPSSVSPIR